MKRIISALMALLIAMTAIQSSIYADNPTLDIYAAGAILMDADTGQILYAQDHYGRYYPASITKLMTALLTLESLKPTDTITFSRNAVLSIEYGSSHIGIKEGEILTVDQALHAILLMSANEAANGLAEEISGSIEAFADAMNRKAVLLGAQDSNFINPNGLHDEKQYTTAYDMALITKALLTYDYFLDVMKDTTYEIPSTNLTD